MTRFPPFEKLSAIIRLARNEDLGSGDLTSRLLVADDVQATAIIQQKQAGVICGLPIVPMVCRVYDRRLRVKELPGRPVAIIEGQWHGPGLTPLLAISGPMRSLLAAERVILNFLQHLSGVATLTRQFVEAVRGTAARIYDTRKTLPGLRLLEKYAVATGGGHNHRMGLFDAVLVKNNHLKRAASGKLAEFVAGIVAGARRHGRRCVVEVEVATLEQLRQVLTVSGVDIVLLDNMTCAQMRRAVAMRNESRAPVELEASGGITLRNVRAVALTGVDRISVGSLTHSAPALDINMSITPAA